MGLWGGVGGSGGRSAGPTAPGAIVAAADASGCKVPDPGAPFAASNAMATAASADTAPATIQVFPREAANRSIARFATAASGLDIAPPARQEPSCAAAAQSGGAGIPPVSVALFTERKLPVPCPLVPTACQACRGFARQIASGVRFGGGARPADADVDRAASTLPEATTLPHQIRFDDRGELCPVAV